MTTEKTHAAFFFLIYFSYFVPCHGAFMFALLSEILLYHMFVR